MSNEHVQKFREPVSNEFVVDAFGKRKSGFKPISAIFEIIDNSIEANSTDIQIQFDWTEHTGTRTFRKAKNMIFIDNGEGMTPEKVWDYFVAAITDKKDKTNGIGKFGVGAYLSCISQTAFGEVYSKTKGGKWHYTCLDQSQPKGKKLPEPVQIDPPKEYEKFEQGTVVIWKNIIQKFTENDIEADTGLRLLHTIGRTYRKFLTDKKIVPSTSVNNNRGGTELVENKNKVEIKIVSGSDKEFNVIPYDPLFVTYNQKKDDTEKPKTVSQKVNVKVDDESGWMVITYSYFPATWWGGEGDVIYKPGMETKNTNQRKISEEDEGISLVREGREIYFGQYPGGPIKITGASATPGNRNYFETHDRFTGIEIEFTRESDEVFAVEFNKSRISMESEVRQIISNAISPTIVSRRNYFTNERAKNEESKNGNNAKKVTKATKIIQSKIIKPEINSAQEKKLREFAEQFKDSTENTEDVFQDLLNGYHISPGYQLDEDGPFVKYSYEGDIVLVKTNMQHPFMKIFNTLLEGIGQKLGAEEGKTGDIDEVKNIETVFNILLASFGFAKNTFKNIDQEEEIATTLRTLINNWGTSAHKLSSIDLDEN
jgi:hypothetical protein